MGFTRLAFIAALLIHIVMAQSVCGQRSVIIGMLERDYGEVKVGMGMENSRAIVEVWLNPIWKNWSIIRTTPNGITCMIAKGHIWRSLWQEAMA